ncbi:cofactor of BRCA1-domain-containing protein [Mycotypha africana]|uniref:cofactor of BRCA1-domain-containing protein n=1 Tax=Mycotypha africana TaxID=64632 RepID=UPI00230064B7|nr:cofactor of BRCA1-domain-containing protein [Mycotypha africana]KAI8979320.1 cofactor of BRCA1-domain-containing protein [Mycotypha africana]
MSTNNKILIGNAAEDIRTLLTSSGAGGPYEAIRSIQTDYGLNFPGIENIYPLLEACGCSRLEIHQYCLKALNDKVVAYIEKDMQPIPMALLQKFEPHIDDEILNKLKADVDVFKNCPWNIKQRIWKGDENFFHQAMVSLLNEYHHNEELQQLAMNIKPGDYNDLIHQRRSHSILRDIMKNINGDPEMYQMFVRLIRIVFRNTPYASLCSLRVDLLMNYHDQDADKITHVDPCHRLIWSLDSCVRNQNMDEDIINNIKECFNNAKNGSQLYADYAMVVMDPLFSNFLAATIVKWLKISVASTAGMETDEHDIALMMDYDKMIEYNAKLLNLAEQAPKAAVPGTKVSKTDKEIKEHLWVALMKIIREESFDADLAHAMIDMLKKSDIARKVFVQYLLDRVQEPNCAVLNNYLALIADSWPDNVGGGGGGGGHGHTEEDAATEERSGVTYRQTYLSFINTLITLLIEKNYLVKCVLDTQFKPIVFFLLSVVGWDASIHKQMIRFIAEYYANDTGKTLLQLGPQVTELSKWTDQMARHGYRDERNLMVLKTLYIDLLTRSNELRNGEFRLECPAVIDFINQATA